MLCDNRVPGQVALKIISNLQMCIMAGQEENNICCIFQILVDNGNPFFFLAPFLGMNLLLETSRKCCAR